MYILYYIIYYIILYYIILYYIYILYYIIYILYYLYIIIYIYIYIINYIIYIYLLLHIILYKYNILSIIYMCVCTVYKIHQSLYHQFSLAAVTSRVCYHPGSTNLKSSKYQSMTSHRDLQRIDVLLVSTCRSRLMSFRPC